MRIPGIRRLLAAILSVSLLASPGYASDVSQEQEPEPCIHPAAWDGEKDVGTWDGVYHRFTAACPDCGACVIWDEEHVFRDAEDVEFYDSIWHRRMRFCPLCDYGFYLYEEHFWVYGDWRTGSDGVSFRESYCALCGTKNPVPDFYAPPPSAAPFWETEPEKWNYDPEPAAEQISVTVPSNLPITVTESGNVYTAKDLCIVNHSSRAVRVCGLEAVSVGNWTLAPFLGSRATLTEGIRTIGISVNDAITSGGGSWESLWLSGNWTIADGATLPLHYDATVSFSGVPYEGEQVLTLVFLLDWA